VESWVALGGRGEGLSRPHPIPPHQGEGARGPWNGTGFEAELGGRGSAVHVGGRQVQTNRPCYGPVTVKGAMALT
jgi:hypothetical protein